MVATSPISAAGGLATLGAHPGKLARGLAGILRRQAISAGHLGKFAQVRWKLFYLLAMIGWAPRKTSSREKSVISNQ